MYRFENVPYLFSEMGWRAKIRCLLVIYSLHKSPDNFDYQNTKQIEAIKIRIMLI